MRIELFGQSGTGKSHAVKVILEEFVDINIPFIVIDPEGEYISFKEISRVVVIGGSYQDLPLEPKIFPRVLKALFKNHVNLIFDLSEIIGFDERSKISANIQQEIFNSASVYRRLFVYLVDEAKLIAPQVKKSRSNDIAVDIAQRGRKRGFIPIFVMQRPSEVDKGVLTQCNIHIMGRLQFPTDIQYIRNFLEDAQITEDEIKRLDQEFFLFTGKETKKIKFRALKVRDLGKTIQPGKSMKLSFRQDTSLKTLIDDLKKTIAYETKEREKKRNKIDLLMNQLKEKEIEIKKLQKELEFERQAKKIAKKIDFSVENGNNKSKQYEEELRDLKGKIKILENSFHSLSKYIKTEHKTNLDLIKSFDHLLPIDIMGIDKRSGLVVGDEIAKIFLNELDSLDRNLYFAMQGDVDLSMSKIWTLISGKGKKTLYPALKKLLKLGLVGQVKRGNFTAYSARKLTDIYAVKRKVET